VQRSEPGWRDLRRAARRDAERARSAR
jgi:hypothetical protein